MKWLKSTFIVLIIAASVCLEQIVIACGGGEDPYDYVSFFHNNTAGNSAYMPFYYISGYEYYEEWDGPYSEQKKDDLNIQEWLVYGDRKFSQKDASGFVYKYGYDELSNLYYHIEQNKKLQLPDSVRQNSMTQWFLQNKDLEALGYLMFAKKCEANATAPSRWDAPDWDATAMDKNIKGGQQLLRAAKKDFFKWRYTYQVLRMAFYKKDYKLTLALYKELIGDKVGDNIMFYRCLSLKAGCYYKQGDYSTAAYLYSRIFNATDDNKHSNYISYDWCFRPHGEDWEKGPKADRSAVVALTKNNKERSAVAIMDALHGYDDVLPLMKEAYSLDPGIKGLDVVMVREINKLEQSVLAPALRKNTGFNNYYYTYSNYYYPYHYSGSESDESRKEAVRQQQKLDNLIAFGQKVYEENKTANASFWPLSVAYLYFVKQDWAAAESWMAKAEKLNPSGNIKDMLLMEKLLLAINKNKKLDSKVEAEILPSLQWLEEKATKSGNYSQSYYNLMTSVLPNVYMKQQDTLKALLCIAKGANGADGNGRYFNWYNDEPRKRTYVDPGSSVEMEQVTTAKIIELKSWIKSQGKSSYESWLLKFQPYEDGALDMYIGTRYLRQHDFAKAEFILKNVPKAFAGNYRFPDPFKERWIDTQEPKDTMEVSDKYTFAKEMLQLQSDMKTATAEKLYRYANGLYSMTYYGIGWQAAMYYRSGSDGLAYYADTTRDRLLPEYKKYYTAEEPMKYYQMAFDKAKDKELKAKCLFMLSKCWQKSAVVPDDQRSYNPEQNDAYFLYSLKSPYFLQLFDQYRETAAFKELIEDCAYLNSYARKRSKQ